MVLTGVDECTRIEILEDIIPIIQINKILFANGVKLTKCGSIDDKQRW
jgi:hypothetical protein